MTRLARYGTATEENVETGGCAAPERAEKTPLLTSEQVQFNQQADTILGSSASFKWLTSCLTQYHVLSFLQEVQRGGDLEESTGKLKWLGYTFAVVAGFCFTASNVGIK